MSEVDWTRLRRLAGPPPRVGQAEQSRNQTPKQTQHANDMLAMLEKEVEDVEQVEASGALDTLQSGDPFQRMMWAQLQQNQLLLQKLIAPRHSDPVLGALDGGGQRRRQFKQWSSGMSRKGHLHSDYAGPAEDCYGGSDQRSSRVGARESSGGCFVDEEVCGKADAFVGAQAPHLRVLSDGRGLGYGSWKQQRGTHGRGSKGAHLLRTGGFGSRSHDLGLADDRSARAPFSDSAIQSEAFGPTAFHQAGITSMGIGEFSLCERFGCAGEQDADYWKAEGSSFPRESRRRRCATEAATQGPKEKAKR